MQKDIRPSPRDPVARVEFSHPAETTPMEHTAAQRLDPAARFSAGTETRSVR